MRLAENESRRIGMKFEALVELSPERSEWGFETQVSERNKVIVSPKITENMYYVFSDNNHFLRKPLITII